MRLEVSGSSYDTAAEALYGANQVAAMAYDRLKDQLAGYHALGGDDTSSEDFVASYDEGAKAAIDALRALVDGLGNLGDVTFASVQNHRRANAESVYGRPRPTYEGGVPGDGPVEVAAYTPPSSLGGDNQDVPDWWNHVVDHLQGFGWPSANTDQLRDAASAWEAAAATVDGLTGKLDVAVSMLETQRSPEIPMATAVLATTARDIADLATELRTLGSACHDYASQVDETRQTIKDLLRDLAVECAVSAGIGVGLSFFTFGGAGAVAAGVVAARAVRYAHLILAALRGLRAARAVTTIGRSLPVIARVTRSLEKLKRARAIVTTYSRAARGRMVGREALNPQQLRNLTRYERRMPGSPEKTVVRDLGDGTVSYTTKVPGNVPGSYAEYTKIVDETGTTIGYVKTTFGPDGRIIHIKDKMNP